MIGAKAVLPVNKQKRLSSRSNLWPIIEMALGPGRQQVAPFGGPVQWMNIFLRGTESCILSVEAIGIIFLGRTHLSSRFTHSLSREGRAGQQSSEKEKPYARPPSH